MTYIVHDPEQSIEEEFEKLDEALKFANEELIPPHLEDGWSEEVENITVSKILYRSIKFNVKQRKDQLLDGDGCDKDGTYWSGEHDEYCEYKMAEQVT